jgi:hypothetical protein
MCQWMLCGVALLAPERRQVLSQHGGLVHGPAAVAARREPGSRSDGELGLAKKITIVIARSPEPGVEAGDGVRHLLHERVVLVLARDVRSVAEVDQRLSARELSEHVALERGAVEVLLRRADRCPRQVLDEVGLDKGRIAVQVV